MLLNQAMDAKSGTHRIVPEGTPVPTCHEGRPNKLLMTPPVPLLPLPPTDQTTSGGTKLPPSTTGKLSIVPPTPVMLGSEAGYSTEMALLALYVPFEGLGLEPPSPEDAKQVTPWAISNRSELSPSPPDSIPP